MKLKSIITGATALFAALAVLKYSQVQFGVVDQMNSQTHTMEAKADASPSTRAYEVAMAGMMKAMMEPLTGKPDLDFVQGMIPHHQGAIDMAKVALQYGKDPDVRSLAETIVKEQESEVAVMKAWLVKTDSVTLAVETESAKANERAMNAMMKNMMRPYTGDADVDFMRGMIPHHQGAIDMAKVALQYAKDPDVLKFAGVVVKAQEDEIAFMTEWLAKRGQ